MNKQVKIAVAVGILVLSGGIFFWFSRGGEEAAAKSDETRTFWMCSGCMASSDLTAKEVNSLAKESGTNQPPLVCQKCKEKKLYRAVKCAKCGTPYFTSDVPDSTGVCPKCNPDAKVQTVEEKEAEEAAQSDEPKAEHEEGAAPVKPRKKIKGA